MAILFTHKKAESKIREDIFKLWEKSIWEIPQTLKISEKVFLVTCYRVELYMKGEGTNKEEILSYFVPEKFRKFCDILESPAMIFEHIVKVASGADSPALGEPEIQGQVKGAFMKAVKSGWVKKYLYRLFSKAIFVSKKIREESELQKGSLSIPRVVSLYIKDFFEQRKSFKTLIVGTGEMGAGISMYLTKEKVPFTIATRNKERAEFLKRHAKLDVIVYTPKTLGLYLKHYDAVIFATESDTPIISGKELQTLGRYPGVIIDLGFPPNVSPDVAHLRDVKYYSIDEFKKIIEHKIREKKELLSYIEFRVKKESKKFERWFNKEQEIVRIIEFVDKKIKEIVGGNGNELKDKVICNRLKKFLLYPVLKSIRSEKPVEEIVKHWVK